MSKRKLEAESFFQVFYGAPFLFCFYLLPFWVFSALLCLPLLWFVEGDTYFIISLVSAAIFDFYSIHSQTTTIRGRTIAIGKSLERIDYHCCVTTGAIGVDVDAGMIAIVDASRKALHPYRCIFEKPDKHPIVFPIASISKAYSHHETYVAPPDRIRHVPGMFYGTIDSLGTMSGVISSPGEVNDGPSFGALEDAKRHAYANTGIFFDVERGSVRKRIFVALGNNTSIWFEIIKQAMNGALPRQDHPQLRAANAKRTFYVSLPER